MTRNYTQRKPSEYNLFRTVFTWLTCNLVYGLYYTLFCNLKVEGRENVPKKGFFIVASNHVSAIDPFLVVFAIRRLAAYMAKKRTVRNKIRQALFKFFGRLCR